MKAIEYLKALPSIEGGWADIEYYMESFALIKCKETLDNVDRSIETLKDSEECYQQFIPKDLLINT